MKTVGTLLHDMANEAQVIMTPEVFDKDRVDIAADHLRKMLHTLNALPPEVMGIELPVEGGE